MQKKNINTLDSIFHLFSQFSVKNLYLDILIGKFFLLLKKPCLTMLFHFGNFFSCHVKRYSLSA